MLGDRVAQVAESALDRLRRTAIGQGPVDLTMPSAVRMPVGSSSRILNRKRLLAPPVIHFEAKARPLSSRQPLGMPKLANRSAKARRTET
jgi:hypothetical protein